ncbi:MAG: hypothetical protein JWQ49_5118 [Edaphobacter sp.]|nr:hypothetical protein [Edaphobacter sp.]
MHSVNKTFAIGRRFCLTATATSGLAILIASCIAPSLLRNRRSKLFRLQKRRVCSFARRRKR